MGFSLSFLRIEGGQEPGDGDREGLQLFLADRNLHLSEDDSCCFLLTEDGSRLKLDGYDTDLNLDSLDKDGPISGSIWHAHLGREECEFIYDLCVAGRFLIINPQGGPTLIVVDHNHETSDLPDVGDAPAWVDSADELAQLLGAPFGRFIDFRDRVIVSHDAAQPAS
ncbi:MAG: hypothetical protein FWF36_02080 [Propionibacteriaceae bacterium]|nr:hypothetical protein [Propionibacteriaceae bacterium]